MGKGETEKRETSQRVRPVPASLGVKGTGSALVNPKDITETKAVPVNDWWTMRFHSGLQRDDRAMNKAGHRRERRKGFRRKGVCPASASDILGLSAGQPHKWESRLNMWDQSSSTS